MSATPEDLGKPDEIKRDSLEAQDDAQSGRGGMRRFLPERRTEFQKAVSESLGIDLPIFGRELFSSVPSTFAPVDRVPVSANYVIGPGDVLLIHAWGRIDVDYSATVDRNGNINLPRIGTVSVAGVQYKDLKDHLREAFGRIFKNFELSVSIAQLRSVQVFVVGQARRPGAYTVSSLSTMVNALFASGGPAPNGSMRRVQLKRDNVVVTEFDVYDFLLKGDKSKDVQLLQGDVIYIPAAGPMFAIAGSVNSPAIFELKDETTLQEAAEFASGLSEFADGDVAIIERVEGHRARTVVTVPLDATGVKQTIAGGDVIRFRQISPRFENAVTLRGNVAWPGRYPWRAGMRVSELITTKESLVTPDYWRKQNELAALDPPMELEDSRNLRWNTNGFHAGKEANERLLRPRNRDEIRTNTEQLRTEIRRSTAEINWDYAVIQRMETNDLSTRLLPFNLGRAIAGDAKEDLTLEPGDVITIFSQADLSVPVARRSKFLRLEGEFFAAGVYKVEPGETLKQVIERAGGLTPDAYLFGAEFNREATKQEQKKTLDKYVTELQQEVDRSVAKQASAGQEPRSGADAASALQAQTRMIERLRSVEPNGRIVLRMKPNASLEDIPDMPVEDGDRFYVPSRSKTVLVVGSVYQDGAQLYGKSLRVRDYLKYAGGPNRNADKSKIFVLRADGSVINKDQSAKVFGSSFTDLKVMPGDTVVVPQAVDKGRFMRELKDWTQIISGFGISAAAIRVLSN